MNHATELMPAPHNGAAPLVSNTDQAAILRALNLDPRKPETAALVLTCQRYGLDPLLKHAVLIQSALYVTRDGLLHVAHASGDFDGIEVEVLEASDTHYIAICTVYRKTMSHPFRYQGRYPKNGRLAAQYGPEMAEKVAECRALRRAFDVSLCSQEELWDNEPAAPVQHVQPRQNAPRPQPTPRQIDAPPATEECDTPGEWDRLIHAYEDLCVHLGLDVVLPNGNIDERKCAVLLESQTGIPIDTIGVDDLKKAGRELPEWSKVRAFRRDAAPKAETAPERDPDLDGLEDPFASVDNNGTLGLNVPPATPPAKHDPRPAI